MRKTISMLLVLSLILGLTMSPVVVSAQVEPVGKNELVLNVADELLQDVTNYQYVNKSTFVGEQDLMLNEIPDIVEEISDYTFWQKLRTYLDVTLTKAELKGQYAQNTRELIRLNRQLDSNLKDIRAEFKDIRKSGRVLNEAQYIELIAITKDTKMTIKNSDYILGSMAAEKVILAKQIKNREFINALLTVEQMINLQNERIDLLNQLVVQTGLALDSLKA